MCENPRARSFAKKVVTPKNASQRRYMEEIEKHDMMFGIGPGGTGKTYIAVAMAVSALRTKEGHRMLLAPPGVGAGGQLGFLPGTLQPENHPHQRPVHTAVPGRLRPDEPRPRFYT